MNEREDKLIELLGQAGDYIASHTRYYAESVADMQHMNGKDREELVQTWLAENPLYQRIQAVLY